MKELNLNPNQLSEMVKGSIPRQTIYDFLSGEKDTGTQTASILMETLGLKVEIEADRTKYLRDEKMKKEKPESLRGRAIAEWEEAGKPKWNLRERIGMCLLIDLEFSIEGLNPAPKFRDAVEAKDLKYVVTWVQGLKFNTWK